jgi:hypothetical protein
MHKRHCLLASVGVLLCATEVLAIEGSYVGRGEGCLEATVTRVRPHARLYQVSVSTFSPGLNPPLSGCSGGTTATGTLRGNNRLIASGRHATADAPVCMLDLRFRGKSLVLNEMPLSPSVASQLRGCSYYHGVSCAFVGRLRQVAKHLTRRASNACRALILPRRASLPAHHKEAALGRG